MSDPKEPKLDYSSGREGLDQLEEDRKEGIAFLEDQIASANHLISVFKEKLKTLDPDSAKAAELRDQISFSSEAVDGWKKEIEDLRNPPEGSDLRQKLELFREIIKNQDDFLMSLPADAPVVFNYHEPETDEVQDGSSQENLKKWLLFWSTEINTVKSELHDLGIISRDASERNETDIIIKTQRKIEQHKRISQKVSSLLRLGSLRLPPQAQAYIAKELEILGQKRLSSGQEIM